MMGNVGARVEMGRVDVNIMRVGGLERVNPVHQ